MLNFLTQQKENKPVETIVYKKEIPEFIKFIHGLAGYGLAVPIDRNTRGSGEYKLRIIDTDRKKHPDLNDVEYVTLNYESVVRFD